MSDSEQAAARQDTIYIIVPAYNEAENIGAFVEAWYPIVQRRDVSDRSRLVIVNDGSRDDTWARLCDMGGRLDRLVPLTRENGGHGPALISGYGYALRQGADYIFQTDSDGQTDPDEFAAFWALRHEYDALFGNRVVRGDGRGRAFVERVLCALLRLCFGVSVPDANAPFRLMAASYVEELLGLLPRDYALPNVMLTALGAYYHKRIRFIEITFRPRQAGKNSMNIRRLIGIGLRQTRGFFAIRRRLKKEPRG